MGRSLFELQARMCPSVGARLRLLFVYLLLVVNAFSGRATKAKARGLRIRAAGRERWWWVADPMELAALWTVFVSGEYGDHLPAQPPRLIVDAGANVGSATLWFRERFPDARVIAIEANPTAFARLQDGAGGVVVEALTLATVRDRFAAGAPIDVLKLNIEGAEWPVLAGPLANIGTIAMEIHEPVPGGRDPDAVLQEVAQREGFELRQGYSQTLAPRNLRWLVRAEVAEKEAVGVPA
jgi:hypothetical protein